jgi:hypothetical protein
LCRPELKKFLKSKYYPVDISNKIIYDHPANREMDCSVRRGYRDVGTIGIKGDRINSRPRYNSFTVAPPVSPRPSDKLIDQE